jgi:hypothetical protein
MSVTAMLEAQLQGRFAMAMSLQSPPDVAAAASGERYACLEHGSSAEGLAWLGRQPAPTRIAASAEAVWRALEATPFGVGAAQLGGPAALAEMVCAALAGVAPFAQDASTSRSAQLAGVYAATQSKLEAANVDTSELRVVSMVCAGGTPWARCAHF